CGEIKSSDLHSRITESKGSTPWSASRRDIKHAQCSPFLHPQRKLCRDTTSNRKNKRKKINHARRKKSLCCLSITQISIGYTGTQGMVKFKPCRYVIDHCQGITSKIRGLSFNQKMISDRSQSVGISLLFYKPERFQSSQETACRLQQRIGTSSKFSKSERFVCKIGENMKTYRS